MSDLDFIAEHAEEWEGEGDLETIKIYEEALEQIATGHIVGPESAVMNWAGAKQIAEQALVRVKGERPSATRLEDDIIPSGVWSDPDY